MTGDAQHHDAAVLLRTEHEVARVLADTGDEASAYPRLLAAIGASLGWEVGAFWMPAGVDGGALRCVEIWQGSEPFEQTTRATTLAPGEGLPGRVWDSGRPAWIVDVRDEGNFPRGPSATRAGLRTAFCFPVRGATGVLGAMEFLARERREPDDVLLTTMTSLGGRIGQCVERWRAETRLRESDARKSAILNAAFDCIVTMDADGRVVEVNPAAERTFGYAAGEMVGRELAELIIPPALRAAHREGVERYVATGQGRMVGHPVELPAMRADGSEFPVEIAITRPRLPGQPLFTGFIRDVTERRRDEQALRSLAEEQAALRRVATVVAGAAGPERVFATVTEEVGRLLAAQTSNMVRYERDGTAVVVGEWSSGDVRAVPLGTPVALDGDTVAARIRRSGRPERLDSYEGMTGSTAEMLRGLGFRAAVGAPITLVAGLWGAVMVSTIEDTPFPAGSEQRIADFTELVALALANAQAREELAASRARIVQAGDAERRRLERNLHDGAQQRLVALALTLRRSELRVADEHPEAGELLRQARAELTEALGELRELARGIHPAILTDRGLEPALAVVAGRATAPVELSVRLDERLPAPVEVAAYYLVAEAVTNAAKHAQPTVVSVRVSRQDGAALIEVADDGVGGADQRAGSGLRGLADRVEALGGTLRVESPAGAGTTLRARIPLRMPAHDR
ncbi:MAG: PAS domain S-box protein [Solirubrobacterales bacterium]|nr:PAS domain S-box protein [Solirubrobacterales bacterium]